MGRAVDRSILGGCLALVTTLASALFAQDSRSLPMAGGGYLDGIHPRALSVPAGSPAWPADLAWSASESSQVAVNPPRAVPPRPIQGEAAPGGEWLGRVQQDLAAREYHVSDNAGGDPRE